MSINEGRLEELRETAPTDIGSIAYAPLAIIGDRLGLYEALATRELADCTDPVERYVREWLAASAASDCVSYDPETNRYSLSPEQALVLADTHGSASPVAGMVQLAVAAGRALPAIERAFKILKASDGTSTTRNSTKT